MVLKAFVIILLVTGTGIAFGELSTTSKYCSSGTCITPAIANQTGLVAHESRPHYDIIMVILSEACEKAIANHVKSDCPHIQDIAKYDTSNQNISGYFYSVDGRELTRSNPEVKNHWQYYTNQVVCIECNGNYVIPDLYNVIILEPKNFTYTQHDHFNSHEISGYVTNSSGYVSPVYSEVNQISAGFTIYGNRYVTNNCYTATIAYSDLLLNDTINYMKSGCKDTKYNNIKDKVVVKDAPWSWDNPFSSLPLKQVVNDMKKNPLGDCRYIVCSETTSTKKPGW